MASRSEWASLISSIRLAQNVVSSLYSWAPIQLARYSRRFELIARPIITFDLNAIFLSVVMMFVLSFFRFGRFALAFTLSVYLTNVLTSIARGWKALVGRLLGSSVGESERRGLGLGSIESLHYRLAEVRESRPLA